MVIKKPIKNPIETIREFKVAINHNKSNKQLNISLPKKKLFSGLDKEKIANLKNVKLVLKGFD